MAIFVASETVVAFAYQVDVARQRGEVGVADAVDPPVPCRAASVTGISSNTTITTGVRGLAAACAGSAIEPAASSAASAAVLLT